MNNQYTPIHKFNGGLGATCCIGCNIIICTGLKDVLYCDKCTQPSERYLKELEIKERIKNKPNE